jgi:hypothetical protein
MRAARDRTVQQLPRMRSLKRRRSDAQALGGSQKLAWAPVSAEVMQQAGKSRLVDCRLPARRKLCRQVCDPAAVGRAPLRHVGKQSFGLGDRHHDTYSRCSRMKFSTAAGTR